MLRVLMITGGWPSASHPEHAPFIATQVEFLRRKGHPVGVFPLNGQRRLTNYARGWRRVRALITEHVYDLIHAQWGQAALLALPKVVPLVITFHGSDLQGLVGPDGRYQMSGRFLRL